MTGYFKIILKFKEEIDQARLKVNLGLYTKDVVLRKDDYMISYIDHLGFSLHNHNGKLVHYMAWERYERLCTNNTNV